jgi:hypothetical protein
MASWMHVLARSRPNDMVMMSAFTASLVAHVMAYIVEYVSYCGSAYEYSNILATKVGTYVNNTVLVVKLHIR